MQRAQGQRDCQKRCNTKETHFWSVLSVTSSAGVAAASRMGGQPEMRLQTRTHMIVGARSAKPPLAPRQQQQFGAARNHDRRPREVALQGGSLSGGGSAGAVEPRLRATKRVDCGRFRRGFSCGVPEARLVARARPTPANFTRAEGRFLASEKPFLPQWGGAWHGRPARWKERRGSGDACNPR